MVPYAFWICPWHLPNCTSSEGTVYECKISIVLLKFVFCLTTCNMFPVLLTCCSCKRFLGWRVWSQPRQPTKNIPGTYVFGTKEKTMANHNFIIEVTQETDSSSRRRRISDKCRKIQSSPGIGSIWHVYRWPGWICGTSGNIGQIRRWYKGHERNSRNWR